MVNDLSVIELDPNGGVPRVEVLLENVDADVATVTIRRTSAGRPFLVRGAIRQAVAGAYSVVDFECPFNMPVQYRAELFDALGVSVGFSNPYTIGVDMTALYPATWLFPADSLYPVGLSGGLVSADTWMHNPLDPAGGVKVSLTDTSARSISRPVPGSVVYPKGRRVGVIIGEPRGGVRGVTLDVWCEDLESADRIQSFLGDYTTTTVPTICVRLGGTESRVRLPQPLFLGVLDIQEEMVDVQFGGSRVVERISGDEVDPPSPGIFIPLLSYADLNAFYASYSVFNGDNATYLSASRRYDLAGYAG